MILIDRDKLMELVRALVTAECREYHENMRPDPSHGQEGKDITKAAVKAHRDLQNYLNNPHG